MIDGVKVKKLTAIPDERGRVMEILRCDDEMFLGFGQVYITSAYPSVTKAWHYHKNQADAFTVINGMVKLVLYDGRKGSTTKGEVNEFFIGDHNHIIVQIPKNVYHGFKCIGETEAIMLNCPNKPYDRKAPDEYRIPPHGKKIPYDWARKDG